MATSKIDLVGNVKALHYYPVSAQTLEIPIPNNSHFMVMTNTVVAADQGRNFGFGFVSISQQNHCFYQPVYTSTTTPTNVTVEVGKIKITTTS
ncbi:MAG: hypothetical protein J6Y28_04235 [Acholeplasmatales bacterium]|nr:hypothetical protein [Methanobrevibacter sp.]MBP5445362.1 hypothetical protein [Acholeplasmatales bacterium]